MDNSDPIVRKGVWIIAPDRGSGKAFAKVITGYLSNVHVEYVAIPPRVIGDRINTDPSVGIALGKVLKEVEGKGFSEVVIACNTLQLWLEEVVKPLGVMIHTTLESMELLYPVMDQRPVWLGTTVFAGKIANFPTLVSLGKPEMQRLTQEIIWRVKAVYGDDVSTAFDDLVEIASKTVLTEKLNELLVNLEKSGISKVILGCTELPLGVDKFLAKDWKNKITMIDPAHQLALDLQQCGVV